MNKKGKDFLPTNCNYSISLDELNRLNFWNYIEAIGGEYKKKKSSKYGRYYKTSFGSLWIRYDYKTGYYFYINLTGDDKGTLIDFIQVHIIKQKNLGKVRQYITNNISLF